GFDPGLSEFLFRHRFDVDKGPPVYLDAIFIFQFVIGGVFWFWLRNQNSLNFRNLVFLIFIRHIRDNSFIFSINCLPKYLSIISLVLFQRHKSTEKNGKNVCKRKIWLEPWLLFACK